MDTTWIVTANTGRARFFFQVDPTAPLEEIEDMVNAAARLRTADTETDDLGQRAASKTGHGAGAATTPSGYQPHQSPAEHQAELFARNVAEVLLRAHAEARFKQLVLVASPAFLGVLRKQLDPKLAGTVQLEIDKDYTHLDQGQLRDQIRQHEKSHH